MPGENTIFPLVDRRAPILDRIREDTDGENVGEVLAAVVGTSVKSDDEKYLEEMEDSIRTTFTKALANNLGISEEEIDESFANDLVTGIINTDESSVLTEKAMKELGVKPVNDEEEEEEESDSEPLF